VCRSRPVTYFAEEERKPVTLDKILKDYYKKDSEPKNKVCKRKLINSDKQHNEIKKKFRLKKFQNQKITKRVDNFVYLSSLLSQKTREQRSPARMDESLV
jgi:hypothetical protein